MQPSKLYEIALSAHGAHDLRSSELTARERISEEYSYP